MSARPRKAAPAKPAKAAPAKRAATRKPAPGVDLAARVVGMLSAHLAGKHLDAEGWRLEAIEHADRTWEALDRARTALDAFASALGRIEVGGAPPEDLDGLLAAYLDAARSLAERL